ncbi:hypothetical protein PC128_g27073, partial [Phytophthora cactorum]
MNLRAKNGMANQAVPVLRGRREVGWRRLGALTSEHTSECQRRRVEQRRQGKSLVPHAQFLLIHCSRRRQNTILKVPSFEMDGGEELQPDE